MPPTSPTSAAGRTRPRTRSVVGPSRRNHATRCTRARERRRRAARPSLRCRRAGGALRRGSTFANRTLRVREYRRVPRGVPSLLNALHTPPAPCTAGRGNGGPTRRGGSVSACFFVCLFVCLFVLAQAGGRPHKVWARERRLRREGRAVGQPRVLGRTRCATSAPGLAPRRCPQSAPRLKGLARCRPRLSHTAQCCRHRRASRPVHPA